MNCSQGLNLPSQLSSHIKLNSGLITIASYILGLPSWRLHAAEPIEFLSLQCWPASRFQRLWIKGLSSIDKSFQVVPIRKALMVTFRLYPFFLLFTPIFVLASTMLGDNINCSGTILDSDDHGPGQKCFVPCPPTQNDDFKLAKEMAMGNGSYYCS